MGKSLYCLIYMQRNPSVLEDFSMENNLFKLTYVPLDCAFSLGSMLTIQ